MHLSLAIFAALLMTAPAMGNDLMLYGQTQPPEPREEPKPDEVCRQVWDNTRILTIGCMQAIEHVYICPSDGRPCEQVMRMGDSNCGRVTKTVCGPPEMFQGDASPIEE